MKRSKLVLIDNLFLPLFWITAQLSALLPVTKNDAKKTLIIKFFGIGSITRIASALKTSATPNQFIMLTLKRNQPVIELLNIDAIYIDDKSAFRLVLSSFRQIFAIWKFKLNRVVDMERSSNLAGIFGLTAAVRKKYARFHLGANNYNYRNQRHISLANKSAFDAIHEILNIPFQPSSSYTNDNEIKSIIININAGDYLPERKFPVEKWLDLVLNLNHTFPNSTFHLSGLKNERDYVGGFYDKLTQKIDPNRIVDQSGQLSLNAFVALLKKSDLFFTNDSGPLHLAYYFKVKTVAIWGPTSDHLVGYRNSSSMLNLVNKRSCSPCFIGPKSKVAKACNGELTCFNALQTKNMIEQIKIFAEN